MYPLVFFPSEAHGTFAILQGPPPRLVAIAHHRAACDPRPGGADGASKTPKRFNAPWIGGMVRWLKLTFQEKYVEMMNKYMVINNYISTHSGKYTMAMEHGPFEDDVFPIRIGRFSLLC